MKLTATKLAMLLLVAALILAIVGLAIRIMRWLLILAAIILIAAAAVQYVGRRGSRHMRT